MLNSPRTVLRAALGLLVAILLAAPAAARYDPAFTWTTLETPHFYIHYHQGGDKIAKRAAVIAEDVHMRLVPRIKWEPSGRTHLVLVDAVDAPNGSATPIPYNLITLYITPPVGEPGFGTTAYEEWLRTLITHEYTHILHLDMVRGPTNVLRYILGRIYFPNFFEPVWMIEGLATYEETEQTSGGRGRSPGAEMVLRMAVLENKFPYLSQAAVFPDTWPSGQVPYLFGESFTRFIGKKYGREKLAEISENYSYYGVPWFVDLNGRWTLGQWYSDLWSEWRQSLKEKYAQQRDEVIAQGRSSSIALTNRGYLNSYPAISPDNTRIAYAIQNADEFPGIYIMNRDGTQDRKLVENTISGSSSGGSLSWSPDNSGLYYTKIDISRNSNMYNDIYYYDLMKRRESRITSDLRARDPHPSPDGKKLLFVMNRLGRTRLAVITLPTADNRPATEKNVTFLSPESENQFETPRYSPDGTMIAVGVWQPGGFKDIWILDKQGNKIDELMHDRAIDGGAAWSVNGKVIYFASDRTGIFNLYAYELASKKISQITNVLGGAFTPAPSPDGKTIVFSSYSATGYDIHLQSVNSSSWKTAGPYAELYPAITYADRPVETKSSNYNPFPTLIPRFWMPSYGFSEESRDLLGFITFGQDAIERHLYSLTGLYSPKTHRTWYAFNYAYDGLYPTLQFSASDMDGTYSDLLSDPTGTKDYVQQERTIDASVVLPFLKIQRQHAFAIGFQRKAIAALTMLPPWPGYSGPAPAQGMLTSGRIVYLYNNAKQYGLSISPEDGRTIEVGYQQYDKSLGSDFNIKKFSADWHEYIRLPWKHHVLQARAFAGASRGDMLPQGVFQVGGDNPGDSTMAVDDESIYLRGYPINAFRGRKAGLASLEYRFPITNIELGISSTPFFFRRLHGAVFGEAGNAWDDRYRSADLKRSIGAEVRMDMDIAYRLPMTFRLVVAEGLDDEGESLVYVSLWMPSLF